VYDCIMYLMAKISVIIHYNFHFYESNNTWRQMLSLKAGVEGVKKRMRAKRRDEVCNIKKGRRSEMKGSYYCLSPLT